MALSPWPTDRNESYAAGLRLQKVVQGAALDSVDRAEALGAVASAMVEGYAPDAPAAIKDEAVLRFAGYLAQSDFGTIVKESIGPSDVEYTVNHANAFRNCGAAALLTRWRVRRAGAIG